MTRFRSKPQEVEAIQWTGDNYRDVWEFVAGDDGVKSGHFPINRDPGTERLHLRAGKHGAQGYIPVPVGHWIVRDSGDPTHLWPVDPEYFAGKYDPIVDAVIHAEDCDTVDCAGECDEDGIVGGPV